MPEAKPSRGGGRKDARPKASPTVPWYAGEHKDALFYLLIAVFFLELVVGGVAFFYGIMHAAPETTGGPPVARFPWLAWCLAAVLAPVGLLLVVHLAGTWLSRALTREEAQAGEAAPGQESSGSGQDNLPEGLRRFYAMVRNAPTLVVLLGILLLGAVLFFAEGALSALGRAGVALIPYIPWLAGSAAALLAVCFLGHAWFVYRQRRMEQEYAYRREVLERTGMVLMDKSCVALPPTGADGSPAPGLPPGAPAALPEVVDVEATASPKDSDGGVQ
ncbi:hypothetical protein [Desulfovibrio sp.]|uniref:hypothetical protein n=1 Tax=Desulfovibrio sp. TaxID=885 RepID=UPI0026239433|nr:hypothetical protein [Desulfovibrio sp.]